MEFIKSGTRYDFMRWRWHFLGFSLTLLALSVHAGEVREVAPRSPLVGDLAGTLYVEADGSAATAARSLRTRRTPPRRLPSASSESGARSGAVIAPRRDRSTPPPRGP